jgi:hypothetical protein
MFLPATRKLTSSGHTNMAQISVQLSKCEVILAICLPVLRFSSDM